MTPNDAAVTLDAADSRPASNTTEEVRNKPTLPGDQTTDQPGYTVTKGDPPVQKQPDDSE